ncbi:hypothetical protein BAUCODRAFT_402046 [Baudoinia panamericana UAMH 10762]|uniref:Uncharacterized protein n=1 Tax=Baudoinia panamericana (strain UAMH 10762) TaxID=717646 RepID=M2NJT5_BAUPA|nr:uncharacterized protein BAUCODRAFT_402046 [Baudoinia panamericana UAMH 10762]EMC99400.1 hypothetical protein BAUCODRAFT_402046 [Baudoinia panamericana UAMH 10762]
MNGAETPVWKASIAIRAKPSVVNREPRPSRSLSRVAKAARRAADRSSSTKRQAALPPELKMTKLERAPANLVESPHEQEEAAKERKDSRRESGPMEEGEHGKAQCVIFTDGEDAGTSGDRRPDVSRIPTSICKGKQPASTARTPVSPRGFQEPSFPPSPSDEGRSQGQRTRTSPDRKAEHIRELGFEPTETEGVYLRASPEKPDHSVERPSVSEMQRRMREYMIAHSRQIVEKEPDGRRRASLIPAGCETAPSPKGEEDHGKLAITLTGARYPPDIGSAPNGLPPPNEDSRNVSAGSDGGFTGRSAGKILPGESCRSPEHAASSQRRGSGRAGYENFTPFCAGNEIGMSVSSGKPIAAAVPPQVPPRPKREGGSGEVRVNMGAAEQDALHHDDGTVVQLVEGRRTEQGESERVLVVTPGRQGSQAFGLAPGSGRQEYRFPGAPSGVVGGERAVGGTAADGRGDGVGSVGAAVSKEEEVLRVPPPSPTLPPRELGEEVEEMAMMMLSRHERRERRRERWGRSEEREGSRDRHRQTRSRSRSKTPKPPKNRIPTPMPRALPSTAMARPVAEEGEEEEEMADRTYIRDYAENTSDAFYTTNDMLRAKVFLPMPRATRDMASAARRQARLDKYGDVAWEARAVLPDGSGYPAMQRHLDEKQIKAYKESVEKRQQENVKKYGGYLVYGPAGGVVRVTEEGQRVGGELLVKAEEEKEREEARKNVEAIAALDAIDYNSDTDTDELLAKIKAASLIDPNSTLLSPDREIYDPVNAEAEKKKDEDAKASLDSPRSDSPVSAIYDPAGAEAKKQ